MITFQKVGPDGQAQIYFVTGCNTLFGGSYIVRGYSRKDQPPKMLPPITCTDEGEANKTIEQITAIRLKHGYTIIRIDPDEAMYN